MHLRGERRNHFFRSAHLRTVLTRHTALGVAVEGVRGPTRQPGARSFRYVHARKWCTPPPLSRVSCSQLHPHPFTARIMAAAAPAASARVAPVGSVGAVRGSPANAPAQVSPYGPQERSHQNEPAPARVAADFEASVPAPAPAPGQDLDHPGAAKLAPNETGDIAVALSGGGVRAAALSTGVLCFLKELGVATRIKVRAAR